MGFPVVGPAESKDVTKDPLELMVTRHRLLPSVIIIPIEERLNSKSPDIVSPVFLTYRKSA